MSSEFLQVIDNPSMSAEPPYADDAEMSLLGAVLLGKPLDKVKDEIEPKHFYRSAHAAVYRAMLDLHTSGLAIDSVSVKEQLDKSGNLTAVGGPDYLISLMEHVVAPSNWPYYSSIIKQRFAERQLIKWGNSAQAAAQAGDFLKCQELARYVPSLPSADLFDGPTHVTALERPAGVTTGIPELDQAIGGNGFAVGNMSVVMAGAKVGKTSFLCQLAYGALLECQPGEHVLYVTLSDMSRDDILRKLIKQQEDINAAAARIRELPLQMYDWRKTDSKNLEPILQSIQSTRAKYRWKAVYLDYLQVCETEKGFRSDFERSRYISRSLQKFCEKTGIPIIAGSQISYDQFGRAVTFGSKDPEKDAALLLEIEPHPDHQEEEAYRDTRILTCRVNRFGRSWWAYRAEFSPIYQKLVWFAPYQKPKKKSKSQKELL